MTLIEFLLGIEEDEAKIAYMQRESVRAETAPIFAANPPGWLAGVDIFVSPSRWAAECEAKRRIIEWHESWPVLVETEPKFETGGTFDISTTTMRMSKRIAWLTQREYVERFGTEPPSSPMLLALAAVYDSHPDFDPAWGTP